MKLKLEIAALEMVDCIGWFAERASAVLVFSTSTKIVNSFLEDDFWR